MSNSLIKSAFMKKFLIFIIIISSFSFCDNINKKKLIDKYQWDSILIRNTTEEIKIYKELDTATYLKPIYKLIEGNEFVGKYKLVTTEHKIINFTQQEKDSIAYYVFGIIKEPVQKENFCTDYMGKLRLDIGNFTSNFSVSYNSICKIDTISIKTNKLYKLLNTKVSFSNY